MDLISVIVPIYNVEKYLSRCVDSILEQTYPNIELILINDGSPDACEEICKDYAEKSPTIKYYKKKNGGLSDARNYGIERANGSFVGFVDSDDWISPTMYQILYKDLINNKADIATVGYEITETYERQEEYESGGNPEVFDKETAIKYLFTNEKYANFAWNKLYKRSLFKDIRFPVGKKMEDLGTTYKLFLKSKYVTYNEAKVYKYFQRPNSILHNVSRGFYEDKLELTFERFKSLKKIYPEMHENYLFFLNAIHECLPYLDQHTELFSNIIEEMRIIDPQYIRALSKNRIVKSYMLSKKPNLYMRIFGKSYDN